MWLVSENCQDNPESLERKTKTVNYKKSHPWKVIHAILFFPLSFDKRQMIDCRRKPHILYRL